MRDGGCRRLVDQTPRAETIEREWRVDGMGFSFGQSPCEDVAGTRRRFEAARAPTAIHKQSFHWRLAYDRRAVGCDIDDTAPIAQHLHSSDDRKQFADCIERMRRDV